jgi:broad specificity phosphatase PhoE
MAIYLVRHAKAGSRSRWEGDDRLRPLSANGQAQATALAAMLAANRPSRLASSEYLRCVQTLEPLAATCALPIEVRAELAEAARFEGLLDLIRDTPDNTVFCSHGDVIPEAVEALLRRGATLLTEPDWRKCSTWVLERDTSGDVTTVSAIPPPDAAQHPPPPPPRDP